VAGLITDGLVAASGPGTPLQPVRLSRSLPRKQVRRHQRR